MTAGEALHRDHVRAGRPFEANGIELIATEPAARYDIPPVCRRRDPSDPESKIHTFYAELIVCQCGVQLAKGEGCGHLEFLDEPGAFVQTRGGHRSIIKVIWLAWNPSVEVQHA